MQEIYKNTVNICGIYSSLEDVFEFRWGFFAEEHKALPKLTRENKTSNNFFIWNSMTNGFIM